MTTLRERLDQVRQLTDDGFTCRQIGDALSLKAGTVKVYRSHLRRINPTNQRRRLPPMVLMKLRREAKQRGIGIRTLVNLLLLAVVEDDLFIALLND